MSLGHLVMPKNREMFKEREGYVKNKQTNKQTRDQFKGDITGQITELYI